MLLCITFENYQCLEFKINTWLRDVFGLAPFDLGPRGSERITAEIMKQVHYYVNYHDEPIQRKITRSKKVFF